MPYFLIAMLVIATVFLILGLIGRGVEAGSGSFTIKVEGKVGPFPRVIFLILSAINYIGALVLFLAAIGMSSNPSTNVSPVANNIVPSVNVVAAATTAPSQVTIDISDQLSGNEYAENVTVNIDGAQSVSLTADQNNPTPDQTITLAEGQHTYQISVQGINADGSSYDFAGQGTLLAEQGNAYSVVADPNSGVAALQPA
jgi:hypothetical protein